MSGSRSRSRSPLSTRSETQSDKADALETPTQSGKADALETPQPEKAGSVSDVNFDTNVLVVRNVPDDWKWEKFRDYIIEICPEVRANVPHIVRRRSNMNITFASPRICLICYNALLDSEIDGKKLEIKRVPRSRSRSRSPLSTRSETQSDKANALETPQPEKAGSVSDVNCDTNVLVVRNVPDDWKWEKFRDYIIEICPEVRANVPRIVKRRVNMTITCASPRICLICYNALLDSEIDGKKLEIKRIPLAGPPGAVKNALKREGYVAAASIKVKCYTADEKETYGLSLGFLASLGIRPPLKNAVFVRNLELTVDKDKVTEVFNLAGRVINVVMMMKATFRKVSAKVEYDHPVEAVQAISMFNRQRLLGRPMVVQFDTRPDNIYMPEGLESLGPGLGLQSEPLRDIRQLVEMQPLKQQFSRDIAELKKAITNNFAQASSSFRNPGTPGLGSLHNRSSNIMTPLNINTMGNNPRNAAPPVFGLNVAAQPSIQPWQELLQQNMGNDLASTLAALQAHSNNTSMVPNTLAALQVHNDTSKIAAGFGQVLQVHNYTSKIAPGFGQALNVTENINRQSSSSNNGNSNFQSQSKYKEDHQNDDNKERKSITSSDMLVFNYLPPSVTAQALNTKMREIGEIMFAEITGHGRAIVRFRNNQDAERCIKLFDCSKVDGQTIKVKYF